MNWRADTEKSFIEPLADAPWPVTAKHLLTERERSLYQCLLDLFPGHKLFIQVALSQLIDVPEGHPERLSIRNQFSQLVADFVLCRSNLSVIAVIELDDRSHERADRQRADARKNKALADAGIRLVRIPAGKLPTMEKLRELVDAHRPLSDRTDIPTLHAPDPELTLVEEVDDPSLLVSVDHAESESRVFKQIILKTILGGVLIVAGWFVYTQLSGFAMQRAFQSLAVRHAVAPSSPKSAILTPTLISAAPAIAGPSARELTAEKQLALQAANALQKKKAEAWAVFYSAPSSCEHPVDWSAQVECGNLYMRAKKLFEQRWSTAGAGANVVFDNRSAAGLHK